VKPREWWAKLMERLGWGNQNWWHTKCCQTMAHTDGNLASNSPPCWGYYSVLPFIARNKDFLERKSASSFTAVRFFLVVFFF